MGKLNVWLMAGLTAMVLTGCGQTPASAPAGSFKVVGKSSAKAAPLAQAKQPSVSSTSSKPATKAPVKTSQPTPAADPKTSQPAASADGETGALKLALHVTGNAPVSGVTLKVFEQADPSMAVEVPLTVANGAATWSQEQVPPGRYTFQVQALGADHKVLGMGNSEAIVTAGKTAEVSVELRVNTATSSIASDETSTTTNTNTNAPAAGGVIGLNIEIL